MAKKQTKPREHMTGHFSTRAPAPDEGKDIYTPPREEEGTSNEIVQQGSIYYASQRYPHWPPADATRQYLASPEDMIEVEHGIVTYIDAAGSDKIVNEELDRRYEPNTRASKKKPPPEYDL